MAKTFKTGDLKEVGRIKVSAKGLREIANKLEQKTGSDAVVNLMVYLTPGETPTDYPDLGYDFSTISNEPKKVEEKPKEEKPVEAKPVVEETKKEEAKAIENPEAEEAPKEEAKETPKVEEAKPAETPVAAETPKAPETPKVETAAPTAEELKAKEIKDKAKVITTEANKSLSSETTPK